MSWVSRFLARGRASPPDPQRGLAMLLPMPVIPEGFALSPQQSLEVGAVWACSRVLAETIAAMPVNVVDIDSSGRRTKLPNDPLAYLLNIRPSANATAQSLKEALTFGALLHDGGYGEIIQDTGGRTAEIQYLRPDLMRAKFTADDRLYYEYIDPVKGLLQFDPSRVLHIRGPSLDGLLGRSIVATAARSVALAAAQDKYSVQYFSHAAIPSGILTIPLGAKLTDDDRAALLVTIKKHAAGPNAHSPLVLERGITFTPVSATPAESQMADARRLSVEDIARWFGIPLPLLQVLASAQGYGTNQVEIFLSWVKVGLAPWIRRFEQELVAKLLPRGPRYIQLDPAALLAGTAKERAEADEIRVRSGILSPNEARERDGLDGIGPKGDVHFVQSTWIPLDRALEAPPPAPLPDVMDGESPDGILAILNKHLRRVKARTEDLARAGKTNGEVQRHVRDLTRKACAELMAEGVDGDVATSALNSVSRGAPPQEIAREVVGGCHALQG